MIDAYLYLIADPAASACLDAHNEKRSLHENTDEMMWNETLAQQAQVWADHLADNDKFEHEDGILDGENLYWSAASKARTCEDAVESWYA